MFDFDFPLFMFFRSSFVFHLLKSYLFDFKGQLFEEFSEYGLEVFDGLDVWLVEVDPDFDTIAGRVVDFGGDKSKAVNFVTPFEIFPQKEESKIFIDLLFVSLIFANLENKSTTFLVLLILPFRLDSFAEKLDRVDLFRWLSDKIT